MDFSRIFGNRLTSLRGKISYFYNKEPSEHSAFLLGGEPEMSFAIPRRLGTVFACFNILNAEDGRQIFTEELCWQGISEEYDLYNLKIDTSALGVGLYFVNVEIKSPFGTFRLYKNKDGVSILSEECCSDGDFPIQFTIYSPKYKMSDKRLGGIIYHIFVDRFMRGGRSEKKEGAIFPEDWEIIPEYPEYPGAPLKNNTFYGGTLDGIKEKLPYISSLGTSIIYISPIFDSVSNHKYDTGDYMSVDKMFGSEEALKDLILEAKKYGIGIVLDGVFNHTGADSIYFNRYGKYSYAGAYQSKDSEFYSWYEFQEYPDKYTSWWGIEILPRINPSKPECRDYFVGDGGVIEKYASMGIDGFRLDVADELSDEFISQIKRSLNKHNNKSILYGEVWEDASNKIAYGCRKRYYLGSELDGVMNYPIRTGLIDYVKYKRIDTLLYALTDIIENAPEYISNMQMNLLGTHDTERILTVFGAESKEGKTNRELRTMKMSRAERALAVARLKMAYTVLATLPGLPSVFYGDEVGLEGYSDPFNRLPYPHGKEDFELLDFYQKIGEMRKGNSVYKRGNFKLLYLDKDFLAFERTTKKHRYVTLLNNSEKEHKILFDDVVTILTDEKKKVKSNYILSPFKAQVLKLNIDGKVYI